jgi:glycosyltransferase involved in cell wall biosynthesis
MPKNNIVFLIRAYNESSRIVGVIESIFGAWFSDILVVDDGSTDGTTELLARAFDRPIHYVKHIVNRGAWAALETGFEYIRRYASKNAWEYVVTFDADGQHDIADIQVFMQAFEKDDSLDVVFGSRFIVKTKSNVPVFRRMILWWGRIFTRAISNVNLTDSHNGYRMLRVKVLSEVKLSMDGMEYASELIDQIHNRGFRYSEVPVNIHYDEYTLGKWQRFGWPFRIVARMIYKKFFS